MRYGGVAMEGWFGRGVPAPLAIYPVLPHVGGADVACDGLWRVKALSPFRASSALMPAFGVGHDPSLKGTSP